MRALLSGTIAAIEAVAVALATLLIVALFAFLIWWIAFDLGAEPSQVLGATAAVWLLAHGVPLAFELSAETMQSFGFEPAALSFTVSLVPLGLTLITIVYALRSGWRFANRGGSGAAGVAGGAIGFGASAGVVSMLLSSLLSESATELVPAEFALAVIVPALVYGAASGVAFVIRSARDGADFWLALGEAMQRGLTRAGVKRPVRVLEGAAEALRLATMLLAAYIGLAGMGVAAAVAFGYTDVIAVSQSLQLDFWGVLMMFVLQLALLPTFVLWSGAWFTGAGFAVGLGSSASPFGALLGPVPGVPLLAAIPDGWGSAAVIAPLLLALVGIVCGTLLGDTARRFSAPALLCIVVFAASLAGLAVALLSWVAGGSLGPGRLATTGIEPWIAAGLAAAELGGGALLGALAARADIARRAVSMPGEALRRFTGDIDDADDLAGGRVREPVGASESRNPDEAPVIDLAAARRDGQGHSSADDEDLNDTDVIHTDVIDDLDLGLHAPPAAPPAREPELFDQREAEETDAPRDESSSPGQGAEQQTEQKTTAPAADPANPDPDALVQAYSWDTADGALEQQPPEEPRRGWRFPRRKR